MAAPENTPWNRFTSFCIGISLFVAFGVVAALLVLLFGGDSWQNPERPAAASREAKLKKWKEEAEKTPAPVVDLAAAAAALKSMAAKKTETLVPGSPTALAEAANPTKTEKHDPAESELLN